MAGTTGSLSPSQTHGIGDAQSLAFYSPKVPRFKVSKTQWRFDPENTTASPTQGFSTIRFKLPNRMLIDLRDGFLKFTVTTSGPGGAVTQWLENNANSIFSTLRVRVGGNTPDEIRGYNKICNFLNETCQVDWVASSFGTVWGVASLAERQAWATGSKTYCVPIMSQFLMGSVLPTDSVEGDIYLELDLEAPNKCMVSSAAFTTQSYALSNIVMWGHKLEAPEYDMFLKQSFSVNGLNMSFKTFVWFQTNQFTGTTFNIPISAREDSLDAYLLTMHDTGADLSITTEGKFLLWQKGLLTSGQLKWGNDYYPQPTPFDYTGDAFGAYLEFLRVVLGDYNGYGIIKQPPMVDIDTFNGSRFVITFVINQLVEDKLISPVGSRGQNQDSVITLQLSGAMANPQVFDVFSMVYRTTFIQPSKRLFISQ